MKKLLFTAFLTFVSVVSFASDESSPSRTILAGSILTLNQSLTVKAEHNGLILGRWLDANDNVQDICFLKVKKAESYDRKLTSGRTLLITKVKSEYSGTLFWTYYYLENETSIECKSVDESKMTISRFRSILLDSDIDLTLNVPEL